MRPYPLALGALLGCPTPEGAVRVEAVPPAWAPVDVADGPEEAADTGEPAVGVEPPECTAPPVAEGTHGAPAPDGAGGLPVGPDFDFDARGRVVTSRGDDLVRIDAQGRVEVLVRHVGWVWNVRSLPSGEVVISRPEHGTLALISEDGAPRPFLGGLHQPMALEVGLDGMVYVADQVADGAVWAADPDTGRAVRVLGLPYPGALALSPDDETLYVVTGQGPFRIAAIDRGEGGDWDPATLREVRSTPRWIDALTTDVCGNLYVGEHDTGQVRRIRVADDQIEDVATLVPGDESGDIEPYDAPSPQQAPPGLTALRFGAGFGGFAEDSLFSSSGGVLLAVPVGVDGRHVLSGE